MSYAVTGPATVSGPHPHDHGRWNRHRYRDANLATLTTLQPPGSLNGFVVNPATPIIAWAAPAAITYGTSLSGVLNAAAANGQTSVPGTYVYTAQLANGSAAPVTATTVLTPGSYTLGAQFTPTDTTDYNSANGLVALTVNKATPTIGLAANANPVFAQSAVTLTATVASAVSTPLAA